MKTRMPVLFIGHGNPMYALEQNAFTRKLSELGREFQRPKAVLCVSAHWMTEGTWVTEMRSPKTIHDFYGFPKELFDVQYPAPGSPEIAGLVKKTVTDPQVHGDQVLWGLDHGTWAVLRHMYPKAEVPVLQMSVYFEQPSTYHYKVGQQLKKLRDQGVLIVGSGNIVHNLRQIRWEPDARPYEWAIEFDSWVKDRIDKREFMDLLGDFSQNRAAKLSVPTPDHYYPLLYVLGASDEEEKARYEYESIDNGSISMRCLSFGAA